MQTGPRIAAAVAVGYALGRTRKMKLAITVGGVLAGRKFSADPGKLVTEGVKRASSSPQLSALAGELRGRLVEAATSAATAAASQTIESMGDRLSQRAENLRHPPAGEARAQRSDSDSEGDEAAADEEDDAAEQRPAGGQRSEPRGRVPQGARGSGAPKLSSRGRGTTRSSAGSASQHRRGDGDG